MAGPRLDGRRARLDLRPYRLQEFIVFEKADLEADHVGRELAGSVDELAQLRQRPRDGFVQGGPFDRRVASVPDRAAGPRENVQDPDREAG